MIGTGRIGMYGLVAGVDEAGRGPLAGPVVAAAVVLDPDRPIRGLADSKTIGVAKRGRLAGEITASSLAWAVASAGPEEIDRVNILQATMRAMERAVAALVPLPDHVLVDGNRCPELSMPSSAIVKGDASVEAISAASILAKVTRDREMLELDAIYPGYGFARHKGYPTRDHIRALGERGPCPCHRRSFAPVRRALHHGRPDFAEPGR
ncbi:MAG: ribonuclease HII [Pseudomonadota bacterium]|nr:ribonuclease HII [Pseudomonadota bacterium]